MTSEIGTTRTRAHPLPAGMRDLLPDEARRRRALGQRVLDHFVLHGYDLVTLPAFEFAEVLERGLGTLDAADVLRFIEPESGEVAALRPDMTPQIARLVATRLAAAPRPIRLCYEGTVVRRRPGRARRHRQVPQAGVELYGVAGLEGDLEILRLAASVLRAVGLGAFVVDVGHAMIARALLAAAPPAIAAELSEALELKDVGQVDAILSHARAAAVPVREARAIAALPELMGGGASDPDGRGVLGRASDLLAGTEAEAPLGQLRALWEAARASGALRDVVRLDLGEIRGLAYYTGAIFHVVAEGPGEPIASGGRYDGLLGRFGAPMPAVGFALHLDAVARAREAARIEDPGLRRVVVAIAGDRGEEIAARLRAAGVAAVVHAPDGDPEGYAAAWGGTHVAREKGGAMVITRVGAAPGEEVVVVEGADPGAVAAAMLGT